MLRTRLIAGTCAGLVISAVTATLLTVIHLGDALMEPMRVVPDHPAPVTLRMPTDSAAGATWLRRSIKVQRGEVVRNPERARSIVAYEEARRPVRPERALALTFVYLLMAGMMTTYLRRYSISYGGLLRTQAGLLGLLVVVTFGAKLTMLATALPPTALPIAALPLWVAVYLDRRTAFMMGLAVSFTLGTVLEFRADAMLAFTAVSITSVLVLNERRKAVHVLLAGIAAGAVNASCSLFIELFEAGSIDLWSDLTTPKDSVILASALGGTAGGVVALFLLGLVGRILGMVSRGRLLDLADLQQPLLQKMQKEAPGSWEHSRAMANLAEAAASAIGADALLTRVGAYYHDLGKTCQCKYFIENLETGETTPHEGLDPDVSADAIMAHVVEGVRILREGGIPEPVVEFAYTHHGTSVIEFFWHRCLEQDNPRGLSEDFFRYPGMRPRTKETAILMLIDSIEAASRTIDPPERDKFEEMINRILFVKMKQGQLDESGLTIQDIRIMASRIADALVKSRHTRVRYPWQDARDKGQDALPIPEASSDDEVARGVEQAARARGLSEVAASDAGAGDDDDAAPIAGAR